jgi:hypothetical protein
MFVERARGWWVAGGRARHGGLDERRYAAASSSTSARLAAVQCPAPLARASKGRGAHVVLSVQVVAGKRKRAGGGGNQPAAAAAAVAQRP